jgi:hypothetical protein
MYYTRDIKRKAYWSHDAMAFEGGLNPQEFYDYKQTPNTMKKYKSLKDLPGYPAGTIWVKDERINPLDSLGYYPEFRQRTDWLLYLPTKCLIEEKDWFQEIKDSPKEYTKEDMEDCFNHARLKSYFRDGYIFDDFNDYCKHRKP